MSNYKQKFEAFAECNNSEKPTALILAQSDNVLKIPPTIPNDEEKDYNPVVSALEIRYDSNYMKRVCQSQLNVRLQVLSESVQNFRADIEKLVRLGYPKAPDAFLISFIDRVKYL